MGGFNFQKIVLVLWITSLILLGLVSSLVQKQIDESRLREANQSDPPTYQGR